MLPLAGKPLLAWTVEAALGSKYVDVTCVSTDDPDIAASAKASGAEVPFFRPASLATDTAGSAEVLLHAIDNYRAAGNDFHYAILLQPTSPLRISADIDNALELCVEKEAKSVTSLCEMDHSPLWANTLPPDHSMIGFEPVDYKGMRSQDLPKYYRFNGAIYIVETDAFRATLDFVSEISSFAYIMPRDRSLDIDERIDFSLAETLIKGIN